MVEAHCLLHVHGDPVVRKSHVMCYYGNSTWGLVSANQQIASLSDTTLGDGIDIGVPMSMGDSHQNIQQL